LLVEQIESYRMRTNTPGSDIELFIPREFFEVWGIDQKRAYELLWTALREAHDQLNRAL